MKVKLTVALLAVGLFAGHSGAIAKDKPPKPPKDGGPVLVSDPVVYTVPEPGSLALLGVGLVGIGLCRRRKG